MASYIPYKSLVPGALKPPSYKNIYGGITGQGMEIVNFVNANNQIISIPFFNGQPTYPIPKGYKRYDPIKKTTTTQPKQQSMLDYGGDGGEYGATESAQDVAYGQAISESGGKIGELGPLGAVGSIGKGTGIVGSMLDPFGVVSGRPTQMSDVLGVIGMATGVSGFGMIGTIGNALNNAAAIQGIANNMGMNVSLMDAISASATGFQNSTLGKSMLKDTKAFDQAKNAFVTNSIDSMIDAGYTVGQVPGGGYVTIDQDGRYSYQTVSDFLDVAFKGKQIQTLQKSDGSAPSGPAGGYGVYGGSFGYMDPDTGEVSISGPAGAFAAHVAKDPVQAQKDLNKVDVVSKALGLTKPFQQIIDQHIQENYGGRAPQSPQPDEGIGYGSGALGMTQEEAAEEEAAMSGEQYGGDNDTGPDADSPGTDADTGGAIGAKGGFFSNKYLKKKKTKRRGLAAR